MGERFPRLLQDLLLPIEQLLAKVLALPLVHEGLFIGRSIVFVLSKYSYAVLVRRHWTPMKATPLAWASSSSRAIRNRTTTFRLAAAVAAMRAERSRFLPVVHWPGERHQSPRRVDLGAYLRLVDGHAVTNARGAVK